MSRSHTCVQSETFYFTQGYVVVLPTQRLQLERGKSKGDFELAPNLKTLKNYSASHCQGHFLTVTPYNWNTFFNDHCP